MLTQKDLEKLIDEMGRKDSNKNIIFDPLVFAYRVRCDLIEDIIEMLEEMRR